MTLTDTTAARLQRHAAILDNATAGRDRGAGEDYLMTVETAILDAELRELETATYTAMLTDSQAYSACAPGCPCGCSGLAG